MMRKDLIYDVGMNNGDDSAYYLLKGFNVVAIEADPTLVEQAKARFKTELEQGRLTILNVGIAKQEGCADFWINEVYSEWNSFDLGTASRENLPHHSIQVPCVKFETILEQYGVPFYLKVDIEGNDSLCLDALSDESLPEYVSVQMGGLELILKLKNLGYTEFKIIDQFTLLPLAFPVDPEYREHERANQLLKDKSVPARAWRKLVGWQKIHAVTQKSRQKSSWTFPMGSSGPFGAETPGRWQSWDDVVFSWLYYRREHKADKSKKEYAFWCDLHAHKASR